MSVRHHGHNLWELRDAEKHPHPEFRQRHSRFRLATTVSAAALMAASPGTASAAEPDSCKTVRFGDVGWSDIAATTGTASVVLQGLGYKTTTQIASVPVVFLGLKKKDIDVFLGNWMPTMETFIRPYIEDKSIEVVRANLEGAKYALAVPTYVAEGASAISPISRSSRTSLTARSTASRPATTAM